MNSTYQVRTATGELLGIFGAGSLLDVKALVQANPGAVVKSVVTIDSPCHSHPAFEASNCPACGTARSL